MSAPKPQDIKAQIGFWNQYGRMLLGGAAAAGAAFLAYSTLGPAQQRSSSPDPSSQDVLTELQMPYRDTSCEELKGNDLSNVLMVDDVDVDGKRVLVRTDYNVVLKGGVLEDSIRVDQSIPTIRRLLDKKARCVVIISHLARPAGEFNKSEFTLEPLVGYLKHCLGPSTSHTPVSSEGASFIG